MGYKQDWLKQLSHLKLYVVLSFIFIWFAGSSIIFSTHYVLDYSHTTIFQRYFTVSYISGIFAILILIYDTERLRALFIAVMPLITLIVFFAIYVVVADINSDGFYSFIMHMIHFVVFGYMVASNRWCRPKMILSSSLFWFAWLSFVWILFPDFVLFYVVGYAGSMLIIAVSSLIMYPIAKIAAKKYKIII